MSAARAKGTAAETAVVNFLRSGGFPHVERRAPSGSKDTGDIAGLPGIVIEVKNKAKLDLAEWVDEASAEGGREYDAQRGRNGNVASVVWHKRRGRSSPGQWYVTMTGWDFLVLLYEWAEMERRRSDESA